MPMIFYFMNERLIANDYKFKFFFKRKSTKMKVFSYNILRVWFEILVLINFVMITNRKFENYSLEKKKRNYFSPLYVWILILQLIPSNIKKFKFMEVKVKLLSDELELYFDFDIKLLFGNSWSHIIKRL